MKLARRIASAFRVLTRGYDAAGASGRWPIAAHLYAPATEALAARSTLAVRADYLAQNSPHIAAACTAWVVNLVGDGPVLQHDDPAVVEPWNSQFYGNCDAEGVTDLCGLLMAIVRSWLVHGEGFIRLLPDPETGALTLLLIPPAQVDATTRHADLGGGHLITAGIETFNGRRLACWLWPRPPDSPFPIAGESRPVPASDMAHVFVAPTPGAVRGVSPLSPVLTRAVETDKVEDAQVALANVCALLGVYLTDPSGTVTLGAPVVNGKPTERGLEPAVVNIVPMDTTVTTVNPPMFAGVNEFTRQMIRSIAAGCGLPYELLSHDLSQVNYSSARLGLMEFRRHVIALQKTLLVGQFLNKVFRRFVALETLAGRLAVDLETLTDPTFIFTGWQQIEPLKETEADVAAIAARLKSRAEIISARGRDPTEVANEIARDPDPLPAPPPALKEPDNVNAA